MDTLDAGKGRGGSRKKRRSSLLLLGAPGLDVVALRVPLVPQELRVHALARLVLVLLDLLDAVAVGLVGLVVRGVVLGLGHGWLF